MQQKDTVQADLEGHSVPHNTEQTYRVQNF